MCIFSQLAVCSLFKQHLNWPYRPNTGVKPRLWQLQESPRSILRSTKKTISLPQIGTKTKQNNSVGQEVTKQSPGQGFLRQANKDINSSCKWSCLHFTPSNTGLERRLVTSILFFFYHSSMHISALLTELHCVLWCTTHHCNAHFWAWAWITWQCSGEGQK